MVIFRNYQWGAEKRNTTLWYDNNFVGTELNPNLSYAKVADGCGLKGVTVDSQQALTEALQTAIDEQAKGVTTFIEVVLDEDWATIPPRCVKKPVVVAGIDKADMRQQMPV